MATAKGACVSLGGFVHGAVLPFLEVTNLVLPAALVAVFWCVAIVNVLTAHSLNAFGIQPRTLHGLLGVLFAPFIHLSFGHVLANTAPFFVLSAVLQKTRGTVHYVFYRPCSLCSGLMVWGFAEVIRRMLGLPVDLLPMGFSFSLGREEDWLNLAVAVLVTFFLWDNAFWDVSDERGGILGRSCVWISRRWRRWVRVFHDGRPGRDRQGCGEGERDRRGAQTNTCLESGLSLLCISM